MDTTRIIFKRVTKFIPIPRAKYEEFPKNTLLYSKQNPETMNNSVTITYRFEITLQLCFFNGSKPKNNDELQPRLSNFFKNFDSNGCDDLCYQGGLDQRKGLLRYGDIKLLLVTLYTKLVILNSTFDDKTSCEHAKGYNQVNNVTVVKLE
ncbi:hypothetical protein Tco_1530450 [Tanacetum coccineum]